MSVTGFEIVIFVLAMIMILALMNMFKLSDFLARAIVKKDDKP